ncbi:uncharacterized protein LOC127734608 isoform X5 [Mytilus californianus]|uniref:uncharacterized protein LOC127734608 isoform X4 n=2 Tax=Mytilus californianus TaxID=6549 RepID=UPI0022466889|nr:uncharacterized protein LOC127734608 isoform X4 [Mytilus californianus]XP_052100537.1 uncharacterized protein LOC127734608 isoform X5 [Mytilus californianus]
MDREDRRRFFVIGSAILEVVTPVFRHKLENNYTNHGVGCFKDYLNSQPLVHTLFHLRHRYMKCCKDNGNCKSNPTLPITYCQWDLLYTENPGPGQHYCYCKYTAKSVQLEDLDITLAGLILLNCCTLGPAEQQAIKMLRQYKNDYLSHNTKCGITKHEYDALWPHLTRFVLQLDQSKQDELVRIKNRPMDEPLCTKYFIDLLDVHKQLDQIALTVQELNSSFQALSTTVHGLNTSLQGIGWNMHGSFQGVNTTLQGIQTSMNKLLYYAEKGVTCTCQRENPDIQRQERKPYKLGQDIFYQHHQFTIENTSRSSPLQKAVITNDGHVAFIQGSSSIEIYNTDGSHVGTIPLQSLPFDITVVNNSTVAVTQPLCNSIDIWDINNQQRVKSIQLSTPCCIGITTINNKLVVGCKRRLLIIDPQTEKVEKTINTGGDTPFRLCGSGDGIFYTCFDSYYLHHYSHSNNKI